MRRSLLVRFCFAALLLHSSLGHAQPSPLVLRQLTRQSGYIFAGTVISVGKPSPGVQVIPVTFRVERGIRGVRTGQVLIIREWAGLWTGHLRYRAGQHVFLFLYSPSKLGLTSPVGDQLGVFAVDDSGAVVLDKGRTAASQVQANAEPASPRISVRKFARAIRRAEEE